MEKSGESTHGLLTFRGNIDLRVSDVRFILQAIEDAYNGIYIFYTISEALSSLPGPLSRYLLLWPENYIAGRHFPTTPSNLSVVPTNFNASLVAPGNHLALIRARFESPGFWQFLGALNPLETIRQFMNDRHERQKDISYRNDEDRIRMYLENEDRRTSVVENRINMFRRHGVSDDMIAQLLNPLVSEPLKLLETLQDQEKLTDCELQAISVSHGD